MTFTKFISQKLIAALFLLTVSLSAATAFAGEPIAEAESTSTDQTQWGWYYNQTIDQINAYRGSSFRPVNLVPNGLVETEPRYHVLYVRNAGAYQVRDWSAAARTLDNIEDMTKPSFRAQGWRITSIALHEIKSGSYIAKRAATIVVHDMDLYADYDVRGWLTYNELMAIGNGGNRIVDVDSFETNGTTYYAAVFVPNTGRNYKRWAWTFDRTRSQIQQIAKNIDERVYRVTDIERNSAGRYNALMVELDGEASKWYTNQTDATLKNDVLRRHGSYNGDGNLYGGARFFDLVPYMENGVQKYDVLTMENGLGNYPTDKDNVSQLQPIDTAFLRTMSRHGIPAANFALSKNGTVIYRAAFGYADLASKAPAKRNSTGRIASISKTITAAAIMKLMKTTDLTLDTKVFGPNGILKDIKPFNYPGYNGNTVTTLNDITIRHLMNHTAGWDRARSGDPGVVVDNDPGTCDGNMECEPTMYILPRILNHAKKQNTVPDSATQLSSIDDIIRFMIKPDDKDYLPAHDPGTKFAYSNFGYTVLQKVIEIKSGKSYEQYIGEMESHMGVQFYAGRSKPENKQPNEWTYHDQPGALKTNWATWSSEELDTPIAQPYVRDMKMIHGHGGWVTTPTDLVKFVSRMDGTTPNPWISIVDFIKMFYRPSYIEDDNFVYYGLAWRVDNMGSVNDAKLRFEHGGTLDGAGSLSLKSYFHRRLTMSFLFNSNVGDAKDEVTKELETFIAPADDNGVFAELAN